MQASNEGPSFDEFIKIASSFLNNQESSSPLSFLNSPEFTNTVQSVTRGLFDNLSSQIKYDDCDVTESDLLVAKQPPSKNRTRNLVLELPVTLEELYIGKRKKVIVKRKKAHEQSDGSYKIVEERHKIMIVITPGMKNDHRIVFQNEADDLPGLDRGDVIIIIKEKTHPLFTRSGDDLLVKFDISIYEMFYFDATIELLDGSVLCLKNETAIS